MGDKLDVVEIQGLDSTRRPGNRGRGPSNGPAAIMLHGFGANANDLVPLSGAFPTIADWYFPHAPVTVEVAGMTFGRAWFPRDMESLTAALYGSYFQDLRSLEPDELNEAAALIGNLIDERIALDRRFILGGFSQGAMVAAEYARRALIDGWRLPDAIILYSGALIAERWWKESINGAGEVGSQDRRGRSELRLPPVFQSHGRDDTVLPFEQGQALHEVLKSVGFAVDFNAFSGGHEIPKGIVIQSTDFVRSIR